MRLFLEVILLYFLVLVLWEELRQLVKRSEEMEVEPTEFFVFLLQLHNIIFSHVTGTSPRWWGTATHLSVLLRAAFVGLTLRRWRYDVCTEARQTKCWRLPVTLAWLRLFKAVRALPGRRAADNSTLLPGFSVTAFCLLLWLRNARCLLRRGVWYGAPCRI